jgi:2OG-Fe(II) oxygenase superfamily
MREIFCSDQVAVFDDYLPKGEFVAVWRYVQNEEYRHVHQDGVEGVFRIGDGNPLIGGRAVYADPQRSLPESPLRALTEANAADLVYPTTLAVDYVIRRLLRHAPKLARWIGRAGQDWSFLSASASVYPQGTGLSWHRDGSRYTGAYIFYSHREWNVTWGGELLIADETTKNDFYDELRRDSTVHQFDNQAENKYLLNVGMGLYLMPKPNRLVVIAGGNAHAISQVNRSAGNRVRASIAGFFFRPVAADSV